MNTETLTLAEFLLERIAEDEAEARDNDDPRFYPEGWHPDHVQRVLAECEAKRRIVDLHGDIGFGNACPTCHVPGSDVYSPESVRFPCPTLRYLAAVYADHPDYREEWRP